MDTFITTANAAMRGNPDNFETVDLKGNQDLIAAARQAGVKHFIFTTFLGASIESPDLFTSAKAKAELALRQSGMTFTILAPHLFMDVWAMSVDGMTIMQGHPVTLVEPGSHWHSMVAMDDVAAYAVAAIDNPAARNPYLPIGGPQGLSWREIVATFERVLGNPVRLNMVKPGETLPDLPEPISQMLPAYEKFEAVLDMGELSKVFGIPPNPLETFIQQKMATTQV